VPAFALDIADEASNIPAARQTRRRNIPLAKALAEARALGVPQWAVAAEAQISPGLLSMIVRGAARATDANQQAIAAALGRRREELFS
jgi:hypothetical protein